MATFDKQDAAGDPPMPTTQAEFEAAFGTGRGLPRRRTMQHGVVEPLAKLHGDQQSPGEDDLRDPYFDHRGVGEHGPGGDHRAQYAQGYGYGAGRGKA